MNIAKSINALLKYLQRYSGPYKEAHASRMNQEAVIETVNAAIRSRMPDGAAARLVVTERPRPANCMVWSICESMKGTWWEAQVDDATGEIVSLLRKGLR